MTGFPRILALLAAAALLAGCGSAESSSGSSGTEAGNGLKIGARTLAGGYAPGAQVEAWPWGQVPGPQGTAPTASAVTDSTGTAILHLPDGRWSVYVHQGGTAFRLEAVVDSSTGTGSTISDTLRAMTSVAGVLAGIPDGTVSVGGLGRTVACDANGFYRIDSLPSGRLGLTIRGGPKDSVLEIEASPGTRSTLIPSNGTISVIPSDTLFQSTGQTPSFRVPAASYSDTGAFAIAFRFTPNSIVPNTLIQWTESGTTGIKMWASHDTLTTVVDGIFHETYGFTGFTPQVGIVWNGATLEIRMGSRTIYSGTSTTLAQRAGWPPPLLGGSGIANLEWIVVAKRAVPADWFATLPKN